MTTNDRTTILIVDDDPEIRHALRLLFEFESFEVVAEASNGMEAIPIALKHQPDFVILDYLMPKLDGYKTAEILRGVAPGARIVAFSAVLDDKPNWADAYLNKDRIAEIAPLLASLVDMTPRAAAEAT